MRHSGLVKNSSFLSQNVFWVFCREKSEVFTFFSWTGPREYSEILEPAGRRNLSPPRGAAALRVEFSGHSVDLGSAL